MGSSKSWEGRGGRLEVKDSTQSANNSNARDVCLWREIFAFCIISRSCFRGYDRTGNTDSISVTGHVP